MSYPVRPYLQWGWPGEESELTLELPQEPWNYGIGGEGGSATAASGIPEAYSIREDEVLHLRPRVLESELAAFKLFLRWARSSGEPFTVRLDADEASTEFSVYLHSQRWQDAKEITFERDAESRIVFVIPFAVRTESGEAFDVSWHALTADG